MRHPPRLEFGVGDGLGQLGPRRDQQLDQFARAPGVLLVGCSRALSRGLEQDNGGHGGRVEGLDFLPCIGTLTAARLAARQPGETPADSAPTIRPQAPVQSMS